MTGKELREKYFQFFIKRGHKKISPAPLVLTDDPTTLFTSSGMQPLIPYLLGKPHPKGKRLFDSQPCFRGQGFWDDTKEVGNNRHTTCFEMMGNWSLGEYFKKEQLEYFFTFLVDKKEGLGLDPKRLYVSIFAGHGEFSKDEESLKIWQSLFKKVGIKAKEGERVVAYGVEKNWWSRCGTPEQMPAGEPGGPNSEVFYRFDVKHDPKFGEKCHPNCDCGQFLEIGNSVFIQYLKQKDGSFKELLQKNVDFGGGLERQLAAVSNLPSELDLFQTDLFNRIIKTIEDNSDKKYADEKNRPAMRVIADHLKGATFMMKVGVIPSNKEQGYILRRNLRRSAVKMHLLKNNLTPISAFKAIAKSVMETYEGVYFDLAKDLKSVEPVIEEEMNQFEKTLARGLQQLEKMGKIDGKIAFDLYQTYGFPLEITTELAAQKGQSIDKEEFQQEFKKHQKLSRSSAIGKFKGGLADHSEESKKYHTAAHLLHASLRKILGTHVQQAGQNITAERLRFDFTHPEKLTEKQLKEIEDLINQKISQNLPVKMEMMSLEEAKKKGALAFFAEKYGEKVKIYSINDHTKGGQVFSVEVCGGPHVSSTGEIGKIEIFKEESCGAGKRRIYARVVLDY